MEACISLLNVPVGAVSSDVSPDLYCNEVMDSSATSADTFAMPSPVNSDVLDSPLCEKGHWDCASCEVRGAVADFKQQHGRYLNDLEKGPFQVHNRGTTGGVTCFFCLTNYERDVALCDCLAPIKLGYVERPLRQLLRQKIKARKGEKFYARFNQAPLVLSRYVGAGPFRYVGAGPRYEKEPQHRTRPGDKDGEGGDAWRAPRYDTYMADFFAQLQDAVGEDGEGGTASSTKVMPDKRACGSEGPVGEPWRWEQLYLEYEVGKACRCVGKWCECDYSRRADGNEGPVGKRQKT